MIYRRELLSNVKSLVIWSAVLGGLVLMMMSVYPPFAEDAQTAEEMLNVFPEPLAKVFGMDTLNLGTYTGFYGVEVHLINTLVGSVYAALLAAGMLAKEENDHTAEFLLSKPVTRIEVTGQKLAAVLTNLFVLNAVITAVSFACTGFAPCEPVLLHGRGRHRGKRRTGRALRGGHGAGQSLVRLRSHRVLSQQRHCRLRQPEGRGMPKTGDVGWI
ncbi:ABC transporter permease subunit [Thermobacillus composti]|nr:ABC transporter permease subunit [Thermobacillus composti]